MAILTGFTRGSDPINADQMSAHISIDISIPVTAEMLVDRTISVTGNITESNRTAIQNSINSYAYDYPISNKVSQLLGSSSTPTLTILPAAGTGSSCSIEGTNLSGHIILTSGLGIVAGGDILKFTLADGMAFPKKMWMTFSASNSNFAGMVTSLFVTNATPNSVNLKMGTGLALNVSTVYEGNYTISGY